MTPFQRSLDRYLTQEPPDDTWWFEKCADLLKCPYLPEYESKIEKWMDFLFSKDHTPEYAANLIDKLIFKQIK